VCSVLQGGILILTVWGQHWGAALGHCLVLTVGILQKHSVKHEIKFAGKNLVWVQGKISKSSTEVDGRWKFLHQGRKSATPSYRSLG